ncbi:uncharacterized protein LOC106651112 [Trichogramma pretiosum]|uniref:uncharacterized protein LOC106651112 n=1 Tax=Trichogramma pretiosum TaxID=7493 RepID=UPI0006C99ABE|nr:uncharacterized protein LOC106651112 [Trichogramma pretiosum]
MLKNVHKCSDLTYPIVKYNETNLKMQDDLLNIKWITETQDTFVTPQVEKETIGKKRELLMKYFRIQACKEALDEIIGNNPMPESVCSTEYINNFCDINFIPLIDDSEYDVKKLDKSPLYGGLSKSYYQEQFDKRNIKSHSDFRNRKRPFVKRSIFTTPPELALEEPKDGF